MKDQIKAAFLVAPKVISITETPAPKLGKDDVLIRPILTAICGSDISFFAGHRSPPAYPIILGHEVVGNVISVGSEVTNFSVGKRVIVEPNYPCGVCSFCRAGHGNICPKKISLGVTIPGCFAQQFIAPAEFTWSIPESMSNENAVTIEPLAVSLHALWQSKVQLGDTIAVVGCGSTGLLLIQAAAQQGVRVFAHDKIESKMEMARNFGAEKSENLDVSKLWQDEGVTSVFECAGASATVELALKSAPRGSQIILMGLSTSPASFEPLRFVREGLHVNGSIIYHHPEDFLRAIALVDKQVLSPNKIVSQVLRFENIQEAMEIASSGEKGKVLLDMGKASS